MLFGWGNNENGIFLVMSVSRNTLKAHKLAIVSKISFRILTPVTIFEYFCRYLYTVGISNRYPRFFLYCTIIFMIALFNPFYRDFTIGHGAFIQAQIKENIKAPRRWPLWGEFTGDWWIPRTKGQ